MLTLKQILYLVAETNSVSEDEIDRWVEDKINNCIIFDDEEFIIIQRNYVGIKNRFTIEESEIEDMDFFENEEDGYWKIQIIMKGFQKDNKKILIKKHKEKIIFINLFYYELKNIFKENNIKFKGNLEDFAYEIEEGKLDVTGYEIVNNYRK